MTGRSCALVARGPAPSRSAAATMVARRFVRTRTKTRSLCTFAPSAQAFVFLRAKKRCTMRYHERAPFVPITQRPPLRWPNGARLAVWVVPNIEYFDEETLGGVAISQLPTT